MVQRIGRQLGHSLQWRWAIKQNDIVIHVANFFGSMFFSVAIRNVHEVITWEFCISYAHALSNKKVQAFVTQEVQNKLIIHARIHAPGTLP